MSGGSYNYLYCHVRGLEDQRGDIQRMADRLEKSGYFAPARATREVLRMLDGAEQMAQALEDVWHAVEWADSGDYGEHQVVAVVEKFVPWPPPGEPQVKTEHAQQTSGGYRVRWDGADKVYPLAKWIEDVRRDGGKVHRRRVIVVEDWTEVEAP